MEREELIRRAQRVMVAWNSHDPLKLAVLYAPDCTSRESGQGRLVHGREGVTRRAAKYFRASVDLDVRLAAVNADGATTFSRWRISGTHTGELYGVAPTGVRFELEGCSVHEWNVNGYAQHEVIYWDQAHLLRAFGVIGLDLG